MPDPTLNLMLNEFTEKNLRGLDHGCLPNATRAKNGRSVLFWDTGGRQSGRTVVEMRFTDVETRRTHVEHRRTDIEMRCTDVEHRRMDVEMRCTDIEHRWMSVEMHRMGVERGWTVAEIRSADVEERGTGIEQHTNFRIGSRTSLSESLCVGQNPETSTYEQNEDGSSADGTGKTRSF